MNENIVEHSGVKGMKWGIRRYQNKDGTRTALGKFVERMKKKASGTISEKIQQRRKPRELTDEELRNRINRMNLELEYKDKLSKLYPKKDKSYARKFVDNFMDTAVKGVSTNLANRFADSMKKENKKEKSIKERLEEERDIAKLQNDLDEQEYIYNHRDDIEALKDIERAHKKSQLGKSK